MMKRLLVAAMVGLALVGCNSGGSNSTGDSATDKPTATGDGANASGDKLRIAFIPKGATHEFWKTMQAGAEKAATELGVELIWKSPLKEDDRAEQVKVVENFVNEKVSGIVLAPLDESALTPPAKEAINAGIPLVIVDSAIKGVEPASFIATNNFEGGKASATELGKMLGGKGKVILLRYAEGSASTMAREEGFLEGAKAAGLEVVSSEQYGGVTRESAQTASENLLQRFKSGDKLSIDGIFCPNESTTFGMLRALEGAGFAGSVKFVGFDSSKELLEGLTAGKVSGLLLQDPFKMGYLGVTKIVAKIKGESIEPQIDSGSVFVTKDNMDSEAVKSVLPK